MSNHECVWPQYVLLGTSVAFCAVCRDCVKLYLKRCHFLDPRPCPGMLFVTRGQQADVREGALEEDAVACFSLQMPCLAVFLFKYK